MSDLSKLTPKIKVSDFVSKLFMSEIQVHQFHLQVSPNALAKHLGLDEYYKAIPDLIDTLVESYQGVNPIITGYSTEQLVDYKDSKQLIDYFTKLLNYIDTNRTILFKDSDYLNLIDNIKTLIKQILYKLKNL